MQNTSLEIWNPETLVLHINSVAYKRIAYYNNKVSILVCLTMWSLVV